MVGEIGFHDAVEMTYTEDDNVVEATGASDRATREARLHLCIHLRHSGRIGIHPRNLAGGATRVAKSPNNPGKQTICFLPGIIEEIQKEAIRRDRSISWIVQRAWRLARTEIRSAPSRAPVSRLHRPDTQESDAHEPKPRTA